MLNTAFKISSANINDENFITVVNELKEIGFSQIDISKLDSQRAAPLGEYEEIVITFLLEPLFKAGLEFCLKEFFDWIKGRVNKNKEANKVEIYNINVYNIEGQPLYSNSNIDRVEERIRVLADKYLDKRSSFKESLYTLLGKGKQIEILALLSADNKYDIPLNTRERARSLMNELNPDLNNFKRYNLEIFKLINTLD